MFKDVFQTERLIVKNTGITVRTLEHYFFEPSVFGSDGILFIMYPVVFGFEFIRCSVH